jgi:hypothetical protein
VTDGFSTLLLNGLAVELHNAGIGTWNTTGIYTSGQTGITLGNVPPTPDRCITLTAYGVTDSPALSDSKIAVQVRCRWEGLDPRPVNDLADLVFALLHGKTTLALSTGVKVVQCRRHSQAPLGLDDANRWSNVQNFYLTVHRPSTNRT